VIFFVKIKKMNWAAMFRHLKEQRDACLARAQAGGLFVKAIGYIACFVLDIVLVFALIPFSITASPTASFQRVARFSPDKGFIDSYDKHLKYYRASVGTALLAGVGVSLQIIFALATFGILSFSNPTQVNAVDGRMLAFWDASGPVPAGWSCQSCGSGDFYQKFPRGAATYGGTGGGTTHTHAMSYLSMSGTISSPLSLIGGAVVQASKLHTHTYIYDQTMNAGTSLPPYRDMEVIRYDTTGAPATIPAGVILMFDAAPSGSWTRYTDQDGSFIYGENDVTGTGGSETHNHTNVGYTVDASAGNAGIELGDGLGAGSFDAHTHTVSGATTNTVSTLPPYLDVLLYKATGETALPDGAIAMWDDTPADAAWTVNSGASQLFNEKFLRGNSSYTGIAAGSATHGHSNLASVTSGPSGGANNAGSGTKSGASYSHTHSISVTIGAATNYLPPYRDVIIAQYSTDITISGTIRQSNESTAYDCSANNLTVNVSVNGGANSTATCTAADGSFSVSASQPSSAGDPIVVSVDSGESVQATTVTLAADTTSAITDLDLYENRLIVRHEDAGPITNAKLATGDNGDAGIRYGVASSNLTVDNNIELHVWTGDTFIPGGIVTTQGSADFHIDDSATATLATTGNTIAGDAVVDTGATLNLNANTTIDGGAIATAGTGTVATSGTPTVTLHGTGSIGGGSGAIAFYNLTIGDASAAATTMDSDVSIANVLNVDTSDSMTIAASKTVTLGASATVTLNGSILGDGRLIYANISTTFPTSGIISSVLRFDSSSGNITIPARTYGGDVELYSNSGTIRIAPIGTAPGQTITIGGDYIIIADGTADIYSNNLTYAPIMLITGGIDFTGIGSGTERIEGGTSNWTITGGIDFTGGSCGCTTSDFTFNGGGTLNFASNTVDDLTITGTYTVTSGSLAGVNGTLDLTGSTTTLTNTTIWMRGSTGTIIGAGNAFSTLSIGNGSDIITVADSDFSVTANLNILFATDTLSIGAGRTVTLSGTLTMPGTISGEGRLTYQNAAAFPTTGTISSILRFDATNNDQTMSTRVYSGAVEIVNSSDAAARTVTMSAGDTYFLSDLTLAANGTQNVTLNAATNSATPSVGGNIDFNGTGAGTEIIVSGAQQWVVTGDVDFTGGTYTASAGNTFAMDGIGKVLTSAGTTFQHFAPYGDITLADALVVAGDVTAAGNFDAAGKAITVSGSWDGSAGAFTPNGNIVTFDATAAGKTIITGGSSFYDVDFNSASGGWTVQTDDMVTHDLTLTDAASFTLESGRTLTVQGNFTNSVPSTTTWTGTTLYLNGSGGLQTINTKGSGDTYATLRIGASEDIAMWDSSAGTVTTDAGGCLLSQDDAGTAGRLNIYGTCNSRANEYWAYATDFDGTALGGASRQADVRFADGASFTVDAGDTLQVLGQSASANRTAITRQSTGNYGVSVDGTLSAQYYDFDYLNASGLNITSTATVSELSDGSYDNNAAGASSAYITVTGNTSATTFTNIVFDSAGDGADANVVYNVNADGSGIDWTFLAAAGNKNGESFDREVNGASVVWTEIFTAVNDGLTGDADFSNDTDTLSANWAMDDETGIDHYEYAFGTTQGGTDVVNFTNAGLATVATENNLALVDGTTYYATIRAINAGDDVMEEASSNGVVVDTAAATFSNIQDSATTTTITITWDSSEGTTTQVRYGITAGYGSATIADPALLTEHSATISGLNEDTTYHYQLVGVDRAGNETTSADRTIVTDGLDPTVITNTQSTVLSSTSVLITWDTNHLADSKVRYGLTTAYGLEEYDATLVTSHSMTLTGLEPGVQYHYEVLSVGNTSTNDADATFITDAEEPEPEPEPEDELTPVENVELNGEAAQTGDDFNLIFIPKSGTLIFIGTAESNATVRIRLDGFYTASTTSDADGNWEIIISVKSTPLEFGEHIAEARVLKNGHSTSYERIAEFQLTSERYLASPTILSPEEDEIVISLRPLITGLAESGSIIHFYIDNVFVGSTTTTQHASGTGSFAFTPTEELTGVQHTLYAVAVSGDSASRNSPDVHFTVELPFIGITFLDAYLVQALPEPYIAFEGIGAGGSRVDFYLNDEFLDRIGLLNGHDSVEHFTYKLYANNLVPKDYTLYAIAYDDSGKSSRKSNVVSFTKSSDVAASILVTSLGSAPVPATPSPQPISLPTVIGTGPGGTYTVQRGDSLWSIAEAQLGDGSRYDEIIALNQDAHPELLMDSGSIYSGWVLRLP
jgi:hypothetical protein